MNITLILALADSILLGLIIAILLKRLEDGE